jgi:hypothetical protein
VILGFHSKQLTERGTEVALRDYAAGARDLLGHDVRIFVPASGDIVQPVRARVEREFDLVLYDDPTQIACDALYVIKRGRPGRITQRIPELNHAFMDASWPHGHRFATVSNWVSSRAVRHLRLPRNRTLDLPRFRKPPVVPHIVTLPDMDDDLRAELEIPGDGVVFGRHGGIGTFSIEFVKEAVRAAVAEREDVWFVFANTLAFSDHPRILFLPLLDTRVAVRRFVNTCDYMIHAYAYGETFGLAVAEFAYVGAPVLTWAGMPRRAQYELLSGDLLLEYHDYEDTLEYLLMLPRREGPVATDIPERFSPERVMARFDEIFLR